jgi:hypothetical protein
MKTTTTTMFTRPSGGYVIIRADDDPFLYNQLQHVHEFCRCYFRGANGTTDKAMLIKMVRNYTGVNLHDACCLVDDAQEEIRNEQA